MRPAPVLLVASQAWLEGKGEPLAWDASTNVKRMALRTSSVRARVSCIVHIFCRQQLLLHIAEHDAYNDVHGFPYKSNHINL